MPNSTLFGLLTMRWSVTFGDDFFEKKKKKDKIIFNKNAISKLLIRAKLMKSKVLIISVCESYRTSYEYKIIVNKV